MGAATFVTGSREKNAAKAFDAARETARYEDGHGGYTGTIAEKGSFLVVAGAPLPVRAARQLAETLFDDPRFEDKWGPAGAIELEGGGWVFFGWASE